MRKLNLLVKEGIGHFNKESIIYTIVNFFIYGVYFLRALFVPKILDNYSYGIFSIFNLYLKFSTIFDLGSISYLQKEAAIQYQNQGLFDSKLERQVVFLNVILVLISTICFLLFNRDIASKTSVLDYAFWISIAVVSQLYVIRTGILRSLERFKVLSTVVLMNALLTTVIILFFFLRIKNIYLIYSVYLLSVFLPIFTYIFKIKRGPIFPLSFLAHSWPIFLYNILFYLYINIDKFTIKNNYSFLEFSTYSLYSNIAASIFMAVSLLWSMFYSKIFGQKSNISERLDTINAIVIFLCLCCMKLLYPYLHQLFPNYLENSEFYNVSILYAALVFFLPNTLVKYLNNKKALFFVCGILLLHFFMIIFLNKADNFLVLLPMLSWITYFLIEMLGILSHSRLLFFVRLLISIFLILVCFL